MQKFDLEALHWRSSTDRQSTWPRGIFGLFGDIFTLNADFIAWKLLKMALEVEYMMDFCHPGLLVTDLHLRSSTDRQSNWPRVIFGIFGDIFTLNADYIAWNYWKWLLRLSTWQSTSIQADRLQIFVEGHPLTAKVPDRGSFWALCLFVCKQDNSKTDRRILIKFSGYVQIGKRKMWLNFGSDPDHCLDLLDPWNLIFKHR